jgi:putative oxidoreductase
MTNDPLNMARFSGPLHALLRVTTALTFISHGTMKLFGFPQMPPMPGAPPMGAPPLLSLMGVAGILELVGGLLVLIGLFTRPVAFLLAGQMAVAYWMAHGSHGAIPATNMGEAAYLFCFVFLWLSAAGAGPFSLDNRIEAAA